MMFNKARLDPSAKRCIQFSALEIQSILANNRSNQTCKFESFNHKIEKTQADWSLFPKQYKVIVKIDPGFSESRYSK